MHETFEVFIAITVHITVFWVDTLCGDVTYQHFSITKKADSGII